jgi:hypothetical protein
MSRGERDNVRSLWFTKGRSAEIAAGFDRLVTRGNLLIDKLMGAPRSQTDHIQTHDLRYEIHRGIVGQNVEKQLPDGSTRRMNTASKVHVYQKGEEGKPEVLIERQRVKDIFPNAPRR